MSHLSTKVQRFCKGDQIEWDEIPDPAILMSEETYTVLRAVSEKLINGIERIGAYAEERGDSELSRLCCQALAETSALLGEE